MLDYKINSTKIKIKELKSTRKSLPGFHLCSVEYYATRGLRNSLQKTVEIHTIFEYHWNNAAE